jgi:hypothetical protein
MDDTVKGIVAVMTMRRYSAQEIVELIDLLKAGGDIPPSELAGMEFLGRLLVQLEGMSDADIAEEVRRRYRFA